ncbi:hypothetical protein Pdw03_3304 [Penicillium digitatum]|uniref:Uncharacterized protein n=1 Tax=Penicillium digitatum TaxID=36651 RepID=A0A7T6XG04_PENDI|nr:hypothetical protein Pdw03_3304 [Penicillium digitatum]
MGSEFDSGHPLPVLIQEHIYNDRDIPSLINLDMMTPPFWPFDSARLITLMHTRRSQSTKSPSVRDTRCW